MQNIHAIRDEIVRSRVSLVIALNDLYKIDKEAAVLAYQLSLTHIAQYFEGSGLPEEDVEEKGNVS